MSDLPIFLRASGVARLQQRRVRTMTIWGFRGIWVDDFMAVRSKAFLLIDGGAGVAGCEDGVVVGV